MEYTVKQMSDIAKSYNQLVESLDAFCYEFIELAQLPAMEDGFSVRLNYREVCLKVYSGSTSKTIYISFEDILQGPEEFAIKFKKEQLEEQKLKLKEEKEKTKQYELQLLKDLSKKYGCKQHSEGVPEEVSEGQEK
jgi:enolase